MRAILKIIFSIGVGTGIAITNGSQGLFTILASSVSLNFNNLVYPFNDKFMSLTYWIELTPSGGAKSTILNGPLTVNRS